MDWKRAIRDIFLSLMILEPMAWIFIQAYFVAYKHFHHPTLNEKIAIMLTKDLTTE